jgi:hypothetical protein
MRKLLLTIAVLSATALPVAGCGGDDEAASAASELAPAGAAFYGEVTIRPEGDQKQAVDAILAKFPGGGQAGDKLQELIEKNLRESDAGITFKDDIEPWLGDEAGFFASGLDASGDVSASAGLIATEDEGKAQEALEKSAEGELTRKTHNDIEYLMDESAGEANAAAVFDGFVVLGNEAGVKAAIDASKGDSKLSDDDSFKDALENAADDRLGFFYVNSPELTKTIQQAGTPLPESFKRFLQEPFVATLDADDDGVLLEANIPEELGKALTFLGQGSDLLTDMPADSWLALGQTDFGTLLDFYVDAFAGVAGGRDAIEQQFRAATGLDLQRDVIDWMGDVAVFVRGTSVPELDGALVIESTDEAASGRLIDALERLARSQAEGVRIGPLTAPGGGKGFTAEDPDVPKPVHVFQQGGRVVFAYGDAAAKDAVDASDKLGDAQEFTAARDSLGDYDVSFYLLMQPILELAESAGADTDAEWQEAKPYLEVIDALVGGTSGDGDRLKSALKLIVR